MILRTGGAPSGISPLSLHDALPIFGWRRGEHCAGRGCPAAGVAGFDGTCRGAAVATERVDIGRAHAGTQVTNAARRPSPAFRNEPEFGPCLRRTRQRWDEREASRMQ